MHFLEVRRVSDFETAMAELRHPAASRGQAELTPGQKAVLETPSESNQGLRNLIDVLAVLERGEPLRAIRGMMPTGQPAAADVLLLTSMQLATTQTVESPDGRKRDPHHEFAWAALATPRKSSSAKGQLTPLPDILCHPSTARTRTHCRREEVNQW